MSWGPLRDSCARTSRRPRPLRALGVCNGIFPKIVGTNSSLKDVIRWLLDNFGKDIIIGIPDLLKRWGFLSGRNILILGPKASGKSALMNYLKSGKPYELIDGEIRPPGPTALAAVVDKNFSIQKGNWLRLKKDVPGDLNLRDTWSQAIKDIKPHGIIYMLDGQRSDNDLRGDVKEIAEFVLGQYSVGLGHLLALHAFVNFADHWARTAAEESRRVEMVRHELLDLRSSRVEWTGLQLGVSATQLSPNKKDWEQAKRAVHHFGADLVL